MNNIKLKASDRGDFTLVEIVLPNEVCEPADLKDLELPDGLDTTKGIVFSGRAPVWLVDYLVHYQAHIYKWVGAFDPRLEVAGVKGAAIVIVSHGGKWRAGDIVPVAKKRGRPKTGQGETRYLSASRLAIVEALENEDKDLVLKLVEEYFNNVDKD